jgi:hypothetical protein
MARFFSAFAASTLLLFSNALSTAAQTTPPDDIFDAVAAGDLARVQELAGRKPALVNAVKVVPVAEWAGMKSTDPQEPEFQAKLTPLVLAVASDRLSIAAWLLSKGARTDYYASFDSPRHPELGQWEGSALFSAVERGDPRMVKLLLDAKADPAQTVRYFGGPPPPKAGDAGPDRSLFGARYFQDIRARLTVFDLCLAPGFRSATLYRLVRRYAPRLKPRYHDQTLFYAALERNRSLFGDLMDQGGLPDGPTLAVLMRDGDAETLVRLAERGLPGLPTGAAWAETGILAAALDRYWYESVLGRLEKPAQFSLAERQAFLSRLAPLCGRLSGVNGALEASRQLLMSVGYPADRSGLNFAARMLFEPWLQPARAIGQGDAPGAKSPALVAQAYSLMVGAALTGTWQADAPTDWKLEFSAGSIRNTGTDGLGRHFETWPAPWRVAIEDGPAGPERDSWTIRTGEKDKPWLTVRLEGDGLKVYDLEQKTTTRFTRVE